MTRPFGLRIWSLIRHSGFLIPHSPATIRSRTSRARSPPQSTALDTVQAPGKVTGTLGMSFSDSRIDIFDNYNLIFINCAGSQAFEAVLRGDDHVVAARLDHQPPGRMVRRGQAAA